MQRQIKNQDTEPNPGILALEAKVLNYEMMFSLGSAGDGT